MVKCKFIYNEDILNKLARNSTKVADLIIEICCGILVVAGAVMFALGRTGLGITAVIVFACLIGSMVVNNLSIKRNNMVFLGREVNIKFDKEVMNVITSFNNHEISNMNINYSVIKNIKEVEEVIYLYLSDSSAVVIPKKCFRSAEDYKLAMELVGKNYIVK